MIEQRCEHCFGSGWGYASVYLNTGTQPEPQHAPCEYCMGTGHVYKEQQPRDSLKGNEG